MFFVNIAKILRTAFFIDHLPWLFLNFFIESKKINHPVMKTLKCFFPIDFAFIISMWCSERPIQPEPMMFSLDFLIYSYFLFVYMQKTYVDFTCINLLLFLFHYIIFIVLFPFSMNFKSNSILNFNTINLFHLNSKFHFVFLQSKKNC